MSSQANKHRQAIFGSWEIYFWIHPFFLPHKLTNEAVHIKAEDSINLQKAQALCVSPSPSRSKKSCDWKPCSALGTEESLGFLTFSTPPLARDQVFNRARAALRESALPQGGMKLQAELMPPAFAFPAKSKCLGKKSSGLLGAPSECHALSGLCSGAKSERPQKKGEPVSSARNAAMVQLRRQRQRDGADASTTELLASNLRNSLPASRARPLHL